MIPVWLTRQQIEWLLTLVEDTFDKLNDRPVGKVLRAALEGSPSEIVPAGTMPTASSQLDQEPPRLAVPPRSWAAVEAGAITVGDQTITVRLRCPHGRFDYCDQPECRPSEVVARRLWWCETHNEPAVTEGYAHVVMDHCRMVEVFMGPIPT